MMPDQAGEVGILCRGQVPLHLQLSPALAEEFLREGTVLIEVFHPTAETPQREARPVPPPKPVRRVLRRGMETEVLLELEKEFCQTLGKAVIHGARVEA